MLLPTGDSRTTNKNVFGILEMLGAEPIEGKVGQAPHKWNFFGKEVAAESGGISIKSAATKMTAAGYAGAGVSAAMGAASILGGYMEGGAGGAFWAASQELAVNRSVARYGYTSLKDGTVAYGGSYSGRSIMKSWAKGKPYGNVPYMSAGLRGGRYMSQMMMGSVGASAFGAVGESLLGAPGKYLGQVTGAKLGASSPWVMAGITTGYLGAKLAYNGASSLLKAGYSHAMRKKAMQTDGDLSAFYTNSAFTMRSRAVEAINRSHLNARSALGQEATYMHRPYRNYHSPYRQVW